MKFLTNHKHLFIISLLGTVLISPLLTSCGSSTTSAGIGGTGITQGRITGFGSIFVNGIEFDTNKSQFEVDGDTSLNEDALRIGMVVRITGSVSSDGLVGSADTVVYDDEIQGPVTNLSTALNGQRTLTIFDKTVTIDESTTSFDDTSFSTINDGDIVEISGFKTSDTLIEASFVQKTGSFQVGGEVELKGTISNLSSSSFTLAGVTINFNSQTEIKAPGSILSNGLFVEVEGTLQSSTEILAESIEVEDGAFTDGVEISLQGVIADFVDLSSFTINGQKIDASNAELSPQNTVLANNTNVEVNGSIVQGVLIAKEVELREGSLNIQAFISINSTDTANRQFQFTFLPTSNTITVKTDNQTSFEDDVANSSNFLLNQLMTGYFVEIEGIDTGSQIIASQVKRVDPGDVEIQGNVDSIDSINNEITVLGVTFKFASGAFTTAPVFGNRVKMVDNEATADGIIDEIDIEG